MICPTFAALSGLSTLGKRVRRRRFLPPRMAMALRVYNDSNGHEWRVWDVTPSTGIETLVVSYQRGWLCFERTDGTIRRRLSLSHVPPAWEGLPSGRLEALCHLAEAAGTRPRGEARPGDAQPPDQRKSGPKSAIGGDDEED